VRNVEEPHDEHELHVQNLKRFRDQTTSEADPMLESESFHGAQQADTPVFSDASQTSSDPMSIVNTDFDGSAAEQQSFVGGNTTVLRRSKRATDEPKRLTYQKFGGQ
jgi:hypothetical protein